MDTTVLTVLVEEKEQIAKDICRIILVDPEGRTLPRFSAGAHIDVLLDDGMIRQYSLCNNPEEESHYEIGVLRAHQSRGGSMAMHDNVQVGDTLNIGSPRNNFPLEENAGSSLLLAGGIGVTPILSMAERLTEIGSPFSMHYCVRNAERAAFLDRIGLSAYSKRTHVHYDDQEKAQQLNLDNALAEPSSEKHVYVCGPTGFLEAVRCAANNLGWAESNVHFEYFSAESPRFVDTETFQIKIASTGETFTVGPEETIIEVLGENDIHVPVSCEQGICGTCQTAVLDGIPDHLDKFFDEQEKAANDKILPCCSRSNSPILVLGI